MYKYSSKIIEKVPVKVKVFLKSAVSKLLAVEGTLHIVFSVLALIGIATDGVRNWMIIANPVADLFFGFTCWLGSLLLEDFEHKH